jgi:hypothetical protein
LAKPPKASVTRAREARAWELSLRGKSCRAIAATLIEEGLGPITFQAVSATLKRVGDRHADELAARVKAYKAQQTHRLEMILEKALEAYEGSQEPVEEHRIKDVTLKVKDGREWLEMPATEFTRTLRWRDGDPRFLAEARAASADIRKIWGLDAQPTDPPADAGAADPEAARRALMAAGGDADLEPEPVDEDDDAETSDGGEPEAGVRG